MKQEKEKLTVNVRKTTKEDLRDFCDKSGTWNQSVLTDVAICEKLEKENSGV